MLSEKVSLLSIGFWFNFFFSRNFSSLKVWPFSFYLGVGSGSGHVKTGFTTLDYRQHNDVINKEQGISLKQALSP